MNQEKIGKFISKSRKTKKLTQEQLAELLDVNHRTISRWENGKNMPDISLFKPLCKILDISIEELINGEKTNKNNFTTSYEKALINTAKANFKNKNKLNNITKLFILFLLTITLFIIIVYKNTYPKIEIYNMTVINSSNNQLNKKITINQKNNKIYFYGIDSIQISDSKNNYYNLKTALKYNQITINDIKRYLENQFNQGNLERYLQYDGGTTIYKNKNYEVIICNTIKGNKDIYFGTPNLQNNLKGAYCGKKETNTCTFTRTYYVLNIQEDNDETLINVTLKEFQGETTIVKIEKSNDLQVGKNYEFTFITYESFENTINNIFDNSKVVNIKETNKIGLDQIQDKICIN